MSQTSEKGPDQPDTVGKFRVGELRSNDSDVMKMTGKFVAERKYSSSKTGSQKILHLGVSRYAISVIPRALMLRISVP